METEGGEGSCRRRKWWRRWWDPDCKISLNLSTTFVSICVRLRCERLELTGVGGMESVLNGCESGFQYAELSFELLFEAKFGRITIQI